MSQEKSASPFSEMTYQEQQDRWLEWRSRQLEFREGNVVEENRGKKTPAELSASPVLLPNLQQAAPTRHQNLDQVFSRMEKAQKKLSAFQTPTEDA